MGIRERFKNVRNDVERLKYTRVRGMDKFAAARAEISARYEKARQEREATKTAKFDQKVQRFEHDTESNKLDRELERSKDEVKEIDAERRALKKKQVVDTFGVAFSPYGGKKKVSQSYKPVDYSLNGLFGSNSTRPSYKTTSYNRNATRVTIREQVGVAASRNSLLGDIGGMNEVLGLGTGQQKTKANSKKVDYGLNGLLLGSGAPKRKQRSVDYTLNGLL